jgi:RHS repeat-associated protein
VLTVKPSSGDPVTMTYDGDHMRRQRAEGAATAKYLWDGAQILMDLDGSDATVARYTLAPFGYGDLLSQRRSNATSFYHFDALGSTRALTESDEDISDTYLYDAWGVLKASTGSTTNPYRYVGKLGYLREAAINGYLLRRRYYREAGGRFLGPDPVYEAAASAYRYVTNRATRDADPSGEQVSFPLPGPLDPWVPWPVTPVLPVPGRMGPHQCAAAIAPLLRYAIGQWKTRGVWNDRVVHCFMGCVAARLCGPDMVWEMSQRWEAFEWYYMFPIQVCLGRRKFLPFTWFRNTGLDHYNTVVIGGMQCGVAGFLKYPGLTQGCGDCCEDADKNGDLLKPPGPVTPPSIFYAQ